jgi:hypothetical protein
MNKGDLQIKAAVTTLSVSFGSEPLKIFAISYTLRMNHIWVDLTIFSRIALMLKSKYLLLVSLHPLSRHGSRDIISSRKELLYAEVT